MVLEHRPFTRTRLDEERQDDNGRVLSVRLNDEELARLEEDARLLRQEKPATALKQLAEIGSFVIHSPETTAVLEAVFNNERRNKRLGIQIADPRFKANVGQD
jgi:hypothetical protein